MIAHDRAVAPEWTPSDSSVVFIEERSLTMARPGRGVYHLSRRWTYGSVTRCGRVIWTPDNKPKVSLVPIRRDNASRIARPCRICGADDADSQTAHDRAVAALDEAMWAEPIPPQAHAMTVDWLDAVLADPAKVAALLAVLLTPERLPSDDLLLRDEIAAAIIRHLTTTEDPS